MIKKTMFFIWCVALVANFTVAQDAGKNVHQKQQVVFDAPNNDKGVHNPNPSITTRTATLITKMWNAYTTQASFTNQIYFDASAGLLAVVHRTDRTGAGSGRIMYQVSDDFGANWSGQIGPMNQPFGKVAGRHPNIALSNPTNSTNVDDVSVVAGIAELDASWRWALMVTAPAPGNANYTAKLDSVFYPGDEMTADNAGNLYASWAAAEPWAGDTLALNVLYRSTDKGTTWSAKGMDKAADYGTNMNGTKIEFGTGSTGFYMAQAQNSTDKYDFAWKKSTDNGATWDANFTWVNWWNASLGSATLGDSCHALNYEVDMIVHGADHPFFVGTFIDTTDGTATGVYVVSNTGSGWKADLVKLVNATSFALPGGLTALNEVEFARNKAGEVLFLKLIDLPAVGDTATDMFGTWYIGGSWTTLSNLTATATVKEKYSQMASRLRTDGTNLTAFPMYTIFGLSDQGDLDESELWLNAVTINDVNDPTFVADNFELSQNYPNPFNPVTNIKYSIANNTNVKLVVFDMLGREVATLVNGAQNAGSYEVNFNASNLSSGIYVYTLTAGNFSSSKKLTLLK